MLLLAWNASNLAGHSKKVLANSMTLIAFCVGNILGPQTFRASQAPGYIGSKISVVVTLTCQIFVCFALRFCNDRLNKKNQKVLERMDDDEKSLLKEKLAYADVTDRKSKSSPEHVLGHDLLDSIHRSTLCQIRFIVFPCVRRIREPVADYTTRPDVFFQYTH
jgi:hypothetical protein